jgi:hypothetical protein
MRFCFVCITNDCVGCRVKFLQGKPAITKDFFLNLSKTKVFLRNTGGEGEDASLFFIYILIKKKKN